MRFDAMTVAMGVVMGLLDTVRVASGTVAVVIGSVMAMSVGVVMGVVVGPLVPVITGLLGVMVMRMLVVDVVVVAVRVTSLRLMTDQVDLGRQPYEGGPEQGERAEKGYQEYPNTTRPARHLPAISPV